MGRFDELEEDESSPYSSISNRPPLEDVAPAPQSNPMVRDFISKRMAPPSDLEADPMMQQYNKEQSDLDAYRQAKVHSDLQANLGQSFSQIAQGANKPVENQVYKSIGDQSKELLGSKEKDLDRKRKVIDAIQARKSQASMDAGHREDRALQRQQIQATRDLARSDKLDKEAKLSEKQLGEVQDFDDSLSTMKSVVGQLGNHSEWTGAIDGRVPDALIGGDQVAFRSELGRMVDKYRKLITGAGASNQELKKLEGRLPQATDTYANFVAKAQNFIGEVERNRGNYIKNLSSQGKNTKPYAEMGEHQETANPGMVRMQAPDGSIRMVPEDKVNEALQAGGKRAD